LALLALFGVLGAGALVARLIELGMAWIRREAWPTANPGPLWKAGALSFLCLIPACMISPEHLGGCLLPYGWGNQVTAEYVFAEALDVSANYEPCDGPGKLRPTLIKVALITAAVGFLWATACRATLPAALFLCSGIVAFGLLPGRVWSLYQLQGLLYPLS